MTANPARRLAAVLLSAAAVVATAPPAGAMTAPRVVREVVTTVEWAAVDVVDAGLQHRRLMVRLTRAFTVDRVL
ncbi:hypothetical protein [Amycolatopsis sp. NPDC003861]